MVNSSPEQAGPLFFTLRIGAKLKHIMLKTPCAVASVYFGALIDVAVAAAFVFGYYNSMRIENAHEMIVTESPSWFPASADSARQSFYCPAVNVTVFGTSLKQICRAAYVETGRVERRRSIR